MLPNTLTPQQTAEILGVKVQTLACWRASLRYDLPWFKSGRRVMYRECDVQTFLEANMHGVNKQ